MTVVDLSVEVLDLPLHTPFVTALRRADGLRTVLVRVTDSEGRVGLGEAPENWQVLGASVEGTLACLAGPLRQAVLGAPTDPALTWPLLDAAVHGNAPAKAALDAALHDLARSGRASVPSVVTLPVDAPDVVARTAAARAAEGWTAFKLKVGTDARTDLDRVRAAREGAPDGTLRIDANQGWDAREAVEVVRALEDAGLGVELVEQPVPAHDVPGLAWVRARVATPVAADESVFDLVDLVEVLRHDAADLVNLKLAKSGGPTPCRELARVARAHGVGVTVGCMLESHVAVGAAVDLAAAVGCDVPADLDGAWWLAAGAPYADRVTYAEGRAVRMEG